jgi:hypothetical protein
LDNCRERRRALNPREEVLDAGSQLIARWRRYEPRVVEPATAGSNDDDAVPETADVA